MINGVSDREREGEGEREKRRDEALEIVTSHRTAQDAERFLKNGACVCVGVRMCVSCCMSFCMYWSVYACMVVPAVVCICPCMHTCMLGSKEESQYVSILSL